MKDMTKGNPTRLILQFAIPLLIGQLFQQVYSLTDTRIVGSFLGENCAGAVVRPIRSIRWSLAF